MKYIRSAIYKKYNANTNGHASPDCVKRSISMAFNIPYVKVGQDLNKIMHELHREKWNISPVFEKYIEQQGGGKLVAVAPEIVTVEEFADAHPHGAYLLETADKPQKRPRLGNHLTCIIDNVLYDSWDSSKCYVVHYYPCNNQRSVVEGDVLQHSQELFTYVGERILELGEKYMQKYGWTSNPKQSIEFEVYRSARTAYTFKFSCLFDASDVDVDYSKKFEIACVFTPETTFEEAKKISDQTVKVRMYDRFAEIKKAWDSQHLMFNQKNTVKSELTEDEYKRLINPRYLSGRELQLYKSLPEEIRARVRYINIWEPNHYHDSYQVRFYKIPGDPASDKSVEFWGYTSSDIKEEVKRYMNDFSRPGDDYDPLEEWM